MEEIEEKEHLLKVFKSSLPRLKRMAELVDANIDMMKIENEKPNGIDELLGFDNGIYPIDGMDDEDAYLVKKVILMILDKDIAKCERNIERLKHEIDDLRRRDKGCGNDSD